MKLIILEVFFLLTYFYADSQKPVDEVKISIGQKMKLNYYFDLTNFLGFDKNSNFVVCSKSSARASSVDGIPDGGDYEIVHINKDTGFIGKKNAGWNTKTLSTTRVTSVCLRENRTLFRNYEYKANKQIGIDAYKYMENEDQLVFFKHIVLINSDRHKFREFEYRISPDSTRFVFYKYIKTTNKKKSGYYMMCTDSTFNTLWEKEIILPFEDNFQVTLHSLVIDIHGDVHLIVEHNESDNYKSVLGTTSKRFWFSTLSENGAQFSTQKISIEHSRYIITPKLITDRNGKLFMVGLYGNHLQSRNGYFFKIIENSTEKINITHFTPFTIDFQVATTNSKEIAPLKKRLEKDIEGKLDDKTFVIREVMPDGEGGFLVTGEQIIDGNHSFNSSKYYANSTTGDIMLLHLSLEGETLWLYRLSKYNTSELPSIDRWADYYGYVSHQHAGKVYYLYYTNRIPDKNMQYSPQLNDKNLCIASIEISTGKVNFKSIESKPFETFYPSHYNNLRWKEFCYFYGVAWNGSKFIEITFPD